MGRIRGPESGIQNNNAFTIITVALLLVMAAALRPGIALAQGQAGEGKPEQSQPLRDKQVVMIIIEGLQNESVNPANTPNINGLAMSAVRAERVSAMPPESGPGRTYSLLSGTDFSQHAYGGGETTPLCPNILSLLEKNAVKTALIDGTGFMRGAAAGISNVNCGPFNGDSAVINAAIDTFKNKRPFFTVVVLAGPGQAAVRYGTGSKEYAAAVAASDAGVGSLFRYLHSNGLYNDTLLIITGTTGSPPLIFKGRDFIAGLRLPPVNIKDLAPTLGYLYGVKFPDSKGHVIWNAFLPRTDRPEIFMLQQRVRDLSNAYADMVYISTRLENEKYAVQQEKADFAREKEIIEDSMKAKDSQISSLRFTIAYMKIGGILALAVFILLLLIEYRVLKKKFLLFP